MPWFEKYFSKQITPLRAGLRDGNLPPMFGKLAKAIEHLACAIAGENRETLGRIERKLEKLIMTQQELAALLDTKTTQIIKVAKEQSDRFDVLSTRIKELEDAINAGGAVSPEVELAVTNVGTALDELDAAIPDAPAPPVEPQP